jgi:hypothetical protein
MVNLVKQKRRRGKYTASNNVTINHTSQQHLNAKVTPQVHKEHKTDSFNVMLFSAYTSVVQTIYGVDIYRSLM